MNQTHRFRLGVCLLFLILTTAFAGIAFGGEFETPPVLEASKILPAKVLKGKLYSVEKDVTNDGYLNTYTITSDYGTFKAVSTAMLYIRIHEISAIAAIDKVDLGEEFGDSVVDGAKNLAKGAKKLVTDPVGTLEGAASGVAKAFGRAQESLFESTPSEYEDSKAANIIGLSAKKREYALEFKVDPYSTNQVLQDRLQKLALAGYTGGLGFGAVSFVLPSSAAMAFTAVRGTDMFNDVDLSVAPADLRKQNREKLLAMGVSEDVARLFINNGMFSPTHQTLLVAALEKCTGVKDPQAFIEFATTTSSEDLAFFRQRMAGMFLDYHQRVGKLETFVPVSTFVAAKTADNELIFCFPLDYAIWASATKAAIETFDAKAKELGVRGKRFRVTGQLSPTAKQELEARGWRVEEHLSATEG